ncbi:MAG: hypothetical protein KDB16_07100, partial [Acidimicrobiales bacterium]|nr:hypothetical protein [Acidimicrobiales bacterium]
MGFNLHRRRVSGILVVLLVVTGVSTVGPAQPAQAAVSVVPESASIDLGAGWGSLIGGGTRVDNVGDPVTFGTVSVTAGFVISYDTCSGESLASGGSCWVSASPADQAIGRRTGTISIHDDGGAVVASIAVQATLFDGVVAFGGTGGYVDRGESFHFNRDNSTLTITDSFGSLIFHGWQAGPMTGSVSISEPDLQLFDPDTRYEGTGLTGNAGLRVSVDGRGCQQEGGTIDIDEVEYELDGSLRRMLASFSAPCGGGEEVTAGIIAVSSTPFTRGLWMPPAQRLAAFAGPTEGVPLFATNLAAVASGPVVADTTSIGPHQVLADGCSGVSLASFEPCEIRIGPGAAPGTGLTGVLGVSDGGSTAQSLVDSDRNTVTYATTLQFAGPDGTVTTRNVTTHLVDDVSIHSFDNAAVELRVDGRTVLEIAAPTGQSL